MLNGIDILILSLALSCGVNSFDKKDYVNDEELAIKRIEYVYSLKHHIDKKIWGGFDLPEYGIPLIYFTDSITYIANSTDDFLKMYESAMVFNSGSLSVYSTSYKDDSQFHMHVSIIFDNTDKTIFNTNYPFLMCSSPEITVRTVPDTYYTEEWATMAMHEYFHGFQFKHSGFLEYFANNSSDLPPANTLQDIYNEYEWFKVSVNKENELLLAVLSVDSTDSMRDYIAQYLEMKDNRLSMTDALLDVDIAIPENIYETMEGTARYVEYGLYRILSSEEPYEQLKHVDSLYGSNAFFRSFDFNAARWLYDTNYSKYYDATGFNLCRVLDKLGIEYKHRLFREGELTLTRILAEDYIEACASLISE